MGIFVTPEERILDLEHENKELETELINAKRELEEANTVISEQSDALIELAEIIAGEE